MKLLHILYLSGVKKPINIKLFLTTCFFLVLSSGFAQSVEVIGGATLNHYLNWIPDDGGHVSSNTNIGWGYNFRMAYENLNTEPLKWRFVLSIDNYRGNINYRNGGIGGSSTVDASINKTLISVGFFPVNIQVKKRFDINLGVEFSGLIQESVSGKEIGWSINNPSWEKDLSSISTTYSSSMYVGLRARLAYDFKLSETLFISPQYSFYLGLSDEFESELGSFKSMRHYFSIGVQKQLLPKSNQ